MLSKLVTRMNQQQALVNHATRAFRATTALDKKPSIGDAVTILQSKVASINQVVSNLCHCIYAVSVTPYILNMHSFILNIERP